MLSNETERYHVDLKWLEENNRSPSVLFEHRLCSACRRKFEAFGDALLFRIRDCCSKAEDFFHPKLPILETVFRLFLANGNQPLTLEEIYQQLKEKRGEAFALAPEKLSRILKDERYYGLRQVRD